MSDDLIPDSSPILDHGYIIHVASKKVGRHTNAVWFMQDQTSRLTRCRLTPERARYVAVISALQEVPIGSEVILLADAELIQILNKMITAPDPYLEDMRCRIEQIVQGRRLDIDYYWEPCHEKNLAWEWVEWE